MESSENDAKISEFGPDAATVTLSAGGVTTRVVQAGSGPDIVWIPGGDAAAEYWLDQFPHFVGDFRCTAYDPRGAGETIAPVPPWTIGNFADDCAAVIRETCNPPVVLIGLSMGALIAQQVAIEYPHLLRMAIPMGTAARIIGFTRDWMQAEIDFRQAGLRLPADFAACHYAAFAYPAEALGDPATWREIRSAYRVRFGERDPVQLIAQWQACLDFDCREALAFCPVPIHAIAFSEDVQTQPAMVREVAEIAPNGTLHEVPGLGHVSFARHRPRVVAALLRQILETATA
ncbi:MAG: alpha/beta hydrolase [Paracoccaceae bacterium]|nr:alpha/beta hydrolase [Paracoccaceae bacterium]